MSSMTAENKVNLGNEPAVQVERSLPEKVTVLLNRTNGEVQKSYPGAYVLPPEQIWWLSREDYKRIYEAIPPVDSFTNRNLSLIGAEYVSKEPYKDTNILFHRSVVFPPEIYIVSEAFDLESDAIDERLRAEYTLVKHFAEIAIFHSKTATPVPCTNEIKDILERRLDFDLKDLPKQYPTVDREKMNALIAGYRDIINLEEQPAAELNGAMVRFLSKIRSADGKAHDEVLLAAGRDSNFLISNFLAEKTVRAVLYSLVEDYPELVQKLIKAKYRALLDEERTKLEQARLFLASVGLGTHSDIFRAYQDSTIPLKFIDAKKKRKKLVYPV